MVGRAVDAHNTQFVSGQRERDDLAKLHRSMRERKATRRREARETSHAKTQVLVQMDKFDRPAAKLSPPNHQRGRVGPPCTLDTVRVCKVRRKRSPRCSKNAQNHENQQRYNNQRQNHEPGNLLRQKRMRVLRCHLHSILNAESGICRRKSAATTSQVHASLAISVPSVRKAW